MTPTDQKLAAALLRLASDEYSNHGCNDFFLREGAGLTEAEAREVVASFNEWDATKNPVGFEPLPDHANCLYDWLLMRYAASKLLEGQAGMSLWMVTPKAASPYGQGSFATYQGFTVRAKDAAEARAIVNRYSLETNEARETHDYPDYWLREEWSSCERVLDQGPAKVLTADFYEP